MAIGYELYDGKMMGWGDDMATVYNPVLSSAELFRQWYLGWSGRAGGALLAIIFRLPNLLSTGPDTFPWWLILSLSLFAVVASPLNLAATSQSLVFKRFNWYIPLILWMIWAVNPIIMGTPIAMPVTLYHAFPVYLFSLCISLASKVDFRERKALWVSLSIVYLLASLSGEQILLSIPIVLSAVSLCKTIQSEQSFSTSLKQISAWFTLSVIANLIYFLSPGQQLRNKLVSTGMPNIVNFREVLEVLMRFYNGINYTIKSIFPALPNFSPIFLILLLIILISVSYSCGCMIYHLRKINQSPSQPLLDFFCLILLTFSFLASFLVSLSHLLISYYFPPYAIFYPSFLLSAGLVHLVMVVCQLRNRALRYELSLYLRLNIIPGNFNRYFESLQQIHWRLMIFCFLGFLMIIMTIPNIEKLINIYKQAVWMTEIRQITYHEIIKKYHSTGKTNFSISSYPINLDNPWGANGYFTWYGYPKIKIVFEGQGIAASEKEMIEWQVIKCSVPALFPWKWVSESRPLSKPVRVMLSVNSNKEGIEEWDFWVPPGIKNCKIIGSLNPNVMGSPLYRENLEFILNLTSHMHKEPIISIDVLQIGELRWPNIKVSLGFVYNDNITQDVPLHAFSLQDAQKRPLVRVSIVNKTIASYLSAYTNVRLECPNL